MRLTLKLLQCNYNSESKVPFFMKGLIQLNEDLQREQKLNLLSKRLLQTVYATGSPRCLAAGFQTGPVTWTLPGSQPAILHYILGYASSIICVPIPYNKPLPTQMVLFL